MTKHFSKVNWKPELSPWVYRNRCFLVALCCLIVRRQKLQSRHQEASPSAGKNTGVVLVPCWAWKCVPTSISRGMNISEVPWCHLLQQMSSQWRSQKLLQGFAWTHSLHFCFWPILSQWIMAILSKECKPGNFVSQNSLKLSFINISGLNSNFVDCKSFIKSNSPDILLYVRQTWMIQLILAISLWRVIFL